MRTIAVALTFLLSLAPAAHAAGDAPADFVLIQQGTLPIILTVPHGGREAIPGIDERNIEGKSGGKGGGKWGGFVKGSDLNTDILAHAIVTQIRELTGKTPYLVMAKFHRKYIDANRPPEIALDNPKARPYYDYYHETVRSFIGEVLGKYPAGILVDVHGQHDAPDVVMRGTHNGRTITQLLKRAGVPAMTGPNGLFGQLEANGFKVFPGNDVPPRGTAENAGLNGGYTVSTYGSDSANGIDTVQMEFGSRYRQKANAEKSGRDAGKAIVGFYEAYLKTEEKK